MNTITRKQAVARIHAGKPFYATFKKRTDGSFRAGIFQYGPALANKGGKPAYNHAEHGLICVFDLAKQAVRALPIEGLLSVGFGEEETLNISDSPDNPL